MNTASKRFSAAYPLSPWRASCPIPDGTVAALDRQHVVFVYAGIAAAEAQISTTIFAFEYKSPRAVADYVCGRASFDYRAPRG